MAQSFRYHFSLFCDTVVLHAVISVLKQPAVSILNCALQMEATVCVTVQKTIWCHLSDDHNQNFVWTVVFLEIFPFLLYHSANS